MRGRLREWRSLLPGVRTTPFLIIIGALLPQAVSGMPMMPTVLSSQSGLGSTDSNPAPAVLPSTATTVPGVTPTTVTQSPVTQPTLTPSAITPSVGPLRLADAVSYALLHSPQVKVAAAQRDIALARLIPQRPVIRPDLTANASQSIEGPTLDLPLPSGRREVIPSQQQRLWVQAEQVLYHSGRSANEVRLSAQTRDADAAYADAVSAVIHDVTTAYYQVLQARSGAAIAHQAIGEVQTSVDTVHTLIQAGQAVPLDLLTAQQALSAVRQDALAADNGLKVAEASFNRSMGRPSDTPISLAGVPPAPPEQIPLDAAIHTALSARPDIRERQAELDSARAGLTLARQEAGPTVRADAAYSLQTPTALQNNHQWTLTAMVSLPLVASSQYQSDVAQAAAGVTAAEAGLQAQRDGDTVLVIKAWEDFQTAAGAVDADGQTVAEQQEALRAAGLRRQVGEVTEDSVAQARLKLEQAMSAQARDQYTLLIREADLQYQMGSFAEASVAGPTVAGPTAVRSPGGPQR